MMDSCILFVCFDNSYFPSNVRVMQGLETWNNLHNSDASIIICARVLGAKARIGPSFRRLTVSPPSVTPFLLASSLENIVFLTEYMNDSYSTNTVVTSTMLFFVLCLALFPAIALGAQQVPLTDPAASPFTVSFDKLVSQNLDRWKTPGLAVAVVNGDDTFSKV